VNAASAATYTSSLFGTASWATIAVTTNAISFVPTTATSASWISASAKITTADTASYIAVVNLPAHTASWATTALTASAISFVPSTAASASWASSSISASYTATASFAITSSNAITASYTVSSSFASNFTTNNLFSRGGVIVNNSYIPNAPQNIVVWRSSFGCTASAFNVDTTGGPGIVSSSVNARRNGSLNLLTASFSSTGSTAGFINLTSLQNQNFSTGDYLEIMMVGTTGSVTQVCIQVDFTR
jgi:hypothetical protein